MWLNNQDEGTNQSILVYNNDFDDLKKKKKTLLFCYSPILAIFFFSSQVLASLLKLERVYNFTDFMEAFSQFGNEMVRLAQITGERQNVSKFFSL